MKAMILAAGRGTRVSPITNSLPKPMIPIIQKPVIQYIIEHLKSHNVDDIVINTSHLAFQIEDYLRSGDQFGVSIAYSYEGYLCGQELKSQAIGSAGGMKKVQSFSGFFDDTFIVLCGDAFIDLDISKAVAFHKAKGSIATVILQPVDHEEVHKYGVVQMDESERITLFQEKPEPEDAVSNLVNTGIYIFEPDVFEYIPAECEYDIGGQLLPALADSGKAIYGYESEFNWVDIGSVPDVFDATFRALKHEVPGLHPPGREIAEGIWVGSNIKIDFEKTSLIPPVFIGSSSSIEDGVSIVGPAVIGSGCSIQAGAHLEKVIIADYTRIDGIANITGKMVYKNNFIDPSGKTLDIYDSKLDWLVHDSRNLHMQKDEYAQLISETVIGSREN